MPAGAGPHGAGRREKPGARTSAWARQENPAPGSRTATAVTLVTLLAAFPDRQLRVVADALYHGPNINWFLGHPMPRQIQDVLAAWHPVAV